MTTREKMQALSLELREVSMDEAAPEARGFVELVQLAAGFGIDIFEHIVPASDAEADVFVDSLIALLVRVRGDDLPPFSPSLYGEAQPFTPPAEEPTA